MNGKPNNKNPDTNNNLGADGTNNPNPNPGAGKPGAGGGSDQKPSGDAGISGTLLALAATVNPYSRSGARYKGVGNGYYTGSDFGGAEGQQYGSDGYASPGMLVYDWVPTVGVCNSRTDAVNLAADFDYRFVRSKNSGARNYAPVDLELVDLCVDSLISWYTVLQRVAASTMTYKADNTYIGPDLVRVLGFDYDDLVENRPLLLNHIDVLGAKLKQFVWIPTHLYHATHIKYNTKIYRDGELSKCQLYIMRQTHFYCYEGADEARGVKLISPYDGNTGLTTFRKITAFTRQLLEPLLGSEDFALIQGDIQKAYDTTAFVTLPTIDMAADVVIDDDDGVKLSLMNATVYPVKSFDTFKVTQDPTQQVLKCLPCVRFIVPLGNESVDGTVWPRALETEADIVLPVQSGQQEVFNFITDVPAAADVVRAHTFHAVLGIGNADTDSSITYPVDSMGTEFIHNATIYVHRYVDDGRAVLSGYQVPSSMVEDTAMFLGSSWEAPTAMNEGSIVGVMELNNFDWHHAVNIIVQNIDSNSSIALPAVWDVQNPVFVDHTIQAKIHEARILTLFNIAG